MPTKNKIRGSKWERDVIKCLSYILDLKPFTPGSKDFNTASTRLMSKGQDAKGIDIWFDEKLPTFIRNLKIQCKEQMNNGKTKSIKVNPLYDIECESGDFPLLFTRITTRPGDKNTKIWNEIVTMDLGDFLFLLSIYKKYFDEQI